MLQWDRRITDLDMMSGGCNKMRCFEVLFNGPLRRTIESGEGRMEIRAGIERVDADFGRLFCGDAIKVRRLTFLDKTIGFSFFNGLNLYYASTEISYRC